MIEIKNQTTDKESGNLILTVLLPHPKEGFVRYHPEQVEEQLDAMGVTRGSAINPTNISNKPGNPLIYKLIYAPRVKQKTPQKTKERLDKKTEPVILKRTNNRKIKSGE